MKQQDLVSQNDFVNKTVPVNIKSYDRKGKEIINQDYYKLQLQNLNISVINSENGTDDIYLSAFLIQRNRI